MDQNTLIIIVNALLTVDELIAPMSIYQVRTFSLLSPDEGAYHTELTGTPKLIICNRANQYYAVANDHQNLPCTQYQGFGCLFKILNSNLNLHSTSDDSCAMALFGYDLNVIKKHCVYHDIFGWFEPTVYQISRDKLFVVNISLIYVHKEDRFPSEFEASWKQITNISHKITINASQSIYTILCEAKVKVLNNIYLSQNFCDDFSLEANMETRLFYADFI